MVNRPASSKMSRGRMAVPRQRNTCGCDEILRAASTDAKDASPPHSSYSTSALPRSTSNFGTPPTGTIGIHYPREIVRIERDWSGGDIAQCVATSSGDASRTDGSSADSKPPFPWSSRVALRLCSFKDSFATSMRIWNRHIPPRLPCWRTSLLCLHGIPVYSGGQAGLRQ